MLILKLAEKPVLPWFSREVLLDMTVLELLFVDNKFRCVISFVWCQCVSILYRWVLKMHLNSFTPLDDQRPKTTQRISER